MIGISGLLPLQLRSAVEPEKEIFSKEFPGDLGGSGLYSEVCL